MDSETAREYLNAPMDRDPSELGEAVDVLYRQYGNYEAIAKEVPLGEGRLSDLRRVFLLPEGIGWQVDKGRIGIGHAREISRLEGNDRWLLAFTIVEAKMTVKESKSVANAVAKKGRPLRDVLQTLGGIRFDELKSLLLPLTFDKRFQITRAAWSKKLDWADFCLSAIEEATRVDLQHIADELARLADQLRPKSAGPVGHTT